MKPRILIIEDQSRPLEAIIRTIRDVERDEDKRLRYGIETFSIDSARWFLSGRDTLEAAAQANSPYDVLVLDLALPEDEPTMERDLPQDDTERGLKLLEFAQQEHVAKEIIIYSIFNEFENVKSPFHHGALDFLKKPATEAELTRAILSAWERVLASASNTIFENRIKTLAPYSEKGIVHQFSDLFSHLIQSVMYDVEGIETNLNERLGIDSKRDSHDPLARHTNSITQAVEEARARWTDLQGRIAFDKTGLSPVAIESTLTKIRNKLEPSLVVKHVNVSSPENTETAALSFAQDVSIILEEIITGALSEELPLKSFSKESLTEKIDVSLGVDGNRLEIKFTDTMPRIPLATAEQINRGYLVETANRFGRVWGLSVAQQLAFRGGGKLEVKPTPVGNVITYRVPPAA